MKFRAVFLDIDDTLFDFRKSSFEALVTAFAEIGVSFTEADMPHYEVYNNRMWEMFERGEIEKEHIYEERFRLYLAERGIEADTAAFNRKYLYELAEGVNFMPHCAELLRVLHGRVKVFILTNGDTYARSGGSKSPASHRISTASSSRSSLAARSRKRRSMTRCFRSSARNTGAAR
ncbi:MAG: HAD family hydrolase [Oscillospiraceae bacterium]